MKPIVIRRLVLVGVVVLTILLSGCATTNGEGWGKKPTHAPLPAVFIEVAAELLPSVCGHYPGRWLHGCAHRDVVICWIYTAPAPPVWLMTHELAHCAGFDHHG